MRVYTFWCEYDLGINDMIFTNEAILRKRVRDALSANCSEESLEELEEAGLFCVESQELERK